MVFFMRYYRLLETATAPSGKRYMYCSRLLVQDTSSSSIPLDDHLFQTIIAFNHIMTMASHPGRSDLMSSIAMVRELLKTDPFHVDTEISSLQQSRYEDRLRFDEERKVQQELVMSLKEQLGQAKCEAQQERSIRKSLEVTNEALEQHKKELTAQLDGLHRLDETPQESSVAPTEVDSIKKLEDRNAEMSRQLATSRKETKEARESAGTWKKSCIDAQRQVKELLGQLESMKTEHQSVKKQQKELLESKGSKYESFQQRLDQSIEARKKAEEELRMIRTTHQATASEAQHTSIQAETAKLQSQYQTAYEAKERAEGIIDELKSEIAGLKKQLSTNTLSMGSTEEAEEEKEVMEKIQSKVIELSDLYTRAKSVVDELQEKDASTSKNLTLAKTKAGAILESTESHLKARYAILQSKVDICSAELKRVRGEFTSAKLAAEKVHLEIAECQKKQKEVSLQQLHLHISLITRTYVLL